MKSDLSKIKVEMFGTRVRFSAPLDQVSREDFEAVVQRALSVAAGEMTLQLEAEILGGPDTVMWLNQKGTDSVPPAPPTATRPRDAGRSPFPLPLPENLSKTPPRRMAPAETNRVSQPRGRTRRNGRAT